MRTRVLFAQAHLYYGLGEIDNAWSRLMEAYRAGESVMKSWTGFFRCSGRKKKRRRSPAGWTSFFPK
ncbi:hypothetical protein N6H14_15500 [Paenibacillus sp. CC-CFT747]|nr:hypothetical protein N6H14_15500 [Paenibacillus sp. CC-CFT747]